MTLTIQILCFSLVLLPLSQVVLSDLGPTDFLKARGHEIKNAAGERVHLRGLNLGGWLLQEKWMTPMNDCPNDGCNVEG